ncbi:protoporphyrinogen/coproporphyrinogen oxidase [Mucilaginibacter gotjawali]|uniref:Protoporphyrinogen oxidase n=1 Tax=Mucilaginibacter gotjawali TaxID=1550579 RepID=A0A839SCF1_9SPHI|nr:NAD(P)-binding protein [Mucilaginibacter gotjawali]MBB3054369.1 protoporphyrinogen oxidase [Mucilaginibacter gotjawali]
MKKATIIGSGISGLSIANMLSGRFAVKVLERSDKTGGLIKCERINGNLFHRVGGHVFNSKNQLVLDWFWKHFNRDNEFLQAKRNAKILLAGKLIGYPLENYLYQLPEEQLRPIIDELLTLIATGKKEAGSYGNFKDFLVGNFGVNLYNLYFGPYNSKIWNTDISKVPLEWLDGKLPMPQIREVIVSNIIKREESSMVHAAFYYPKRDGSQFIIDKLAEQQDISLSYHVSDIKFQNGQLALNNGDIVTDVLVYCGDVRQLASIINIDDDTLNEALKNVSDLLSNGTSNVLCETDDNDLSWLYLPEDKFKAHRIIYTGNFSGTNNEGSKRKTCVVEFSGKQEKPTMIEELALLPGNLSPLAFNYEPDSYIIQQNGTRDKIARLKELLVTYNIYLLGRFGEWEYYNMDKCIEAAMELNEKLS